MIIYNLYIRYAWDAHGGTVAVQPRGRRGLIANEVT